MNRQEKIEKMAKAIAFASAHIDKLMWDKGDKEGQKFVRHYRKLAEAGLTALEEPLTCGVCGGRGFTGIQDKPQHYSISACPKCKTEPVTLEGLEYWKRYQLGQVSLDHTDKEAFIGAISPILTLLREAVGVVKMCRDHLMVKPSTDWFYTQEPDDAESIEAFLAKVGG